MLFILFRRKMLRAHLSPLLKIEFATFCQVLEPRYSATEQAMLLAWATHVKKGSAQVSLFFLCKRTGVTTKTTCKPQEDGKGRTARSMD
jgi:hypothetical protein